MSGTEAAAINGEISSGMSIDDATAMLESRMSEQDADGDDDAQAGNADEDDSGSQGDGAEIDEQDADIDEEGDDGAEAAEDDEQVSIETLSELAEALDQPLDDVLNNLKATITVDGQQREVTLKEALDGYNLAQASQQKMQQAAEERRQVEAERTQHRSQMERQHQILGGIVNKVRQLFVGEINSAELEALKTQDPGRYAQVRLELEDRQRAFDQLLQEGGSAYEELGVTRTQEEQRRHAEYVQAEYEKMQALDGWTAEEPARITAYLSTKYGFTPEEINGITDHRVIAIVRAAMANDQLKEKAKTVTKKVKQLPKLQRPGQKQQAQRADSDAARKAKNRFSQTNKLDDAAAYLAAQLGSSSR